MMPVGSLEQSPARDRTPRAVAQVGLVALGTIIIASYASLARPLWLDEFVQFAVSGLALPRAVEVVSTTTGDGLNHGQTGLYFLLDYALLNVFGASTLALRLPSILAGAAMLTAAVLFIRDRGYSLAWQYFVLVAFAGQLTLMYYVGEARPYMLLASTTVAMFAYFQMPRERQVSAIGRTLGLFGVIVGSLAHPYFILFLVLAIGFTWWQRSFEQGRMVGWRSMGSVLNLRLAASGLALYLLVGVATWLQGNPDHGKDPWEPYGSAFATWRLVFRAHAGVLVPFPSLSPTALAIAVAVVASAIGGLMLMLGVRRLLPPVVLIAVGLASTSLLLTVSAVRAYWIFERQWVAGMALVTLGIAWFVAEAHAAAVSRPGGRGRVGRIIVGFVVAIMTANAVLSVTARWVEFADQLEARAAFVVESGPMLDDERRRPTEDWVDYANRNVISGGAVWPGMGEYYVDWMPPAWTPTRGFDEAVD